MNCQKPVKHNEDIKYWIDRAKKDPKNLVSKLWWADAFRNSIIAHDIKKVFREKEVAILDVPCGLAPICEFLEAYDVKSAYVGIDKNDSSDIDADSRLRAYGEYHYPRGVFTFLKEDWNESVFDNDPAFDVVFCLDGPEHLVNDLAGLEKLFERFSDVMRSDGRLYVSTPNAKVDGTLHYPYCHDIEFSINEIVTILSKRFDIRTIAGYRRAPESKKGQKEVKQFYDIGLGSTGLLAKTEIPYHLAAPFIAWQHPYIADSVLYVAIRK